MEDLVPQEAAAGCQTAGAAAARQGGVGRAGEEGRRTSEGEGNRAVGEGNQGAGATQLCAAGGGGSRGGGPLTVTHAAAGSIHSVFALSDGSVWVCAAKRAQRFSRNRGISTDFTEGAMQVGVARCETGDATLEAPSTPCAALSSRMLPAVVRPPAWRLLHAAHAYPRDPYPAFRCRCRCATAACST